MSEETNEDGSIAAPNDTAPDAVQPNAPALLKRAFTPPTPGEQILSFRNNNTYTIGKPIGQGAFSIVYACEDVWRNELAVKVLKPKGSYEDVRRNAEKELDKLLALRHPNITYIYDAFEYRDTFYLITERCSGSVKDLFSLDAFDGVVWIMPVARALLQALHFAHVNLIAHQDIHPDNVLSTFIRDEMMDGQSAIQFKLADLGVAKLFHEIDGSNTRNQSILPPECIKPDVFGPVDFRVDLYHAGLLLLQLATSKLRGFTQEEILSGVPRQVAEQLPAPLNFAIGKALRRHVSMRTSSAMELWRDLQGAT